MSISAFPFIRPRRLRASAAIQSMVRETRLHRSNLIAPLFIMEGDGPSVEIPSMPGIFRHSIKSARAEAKRLFDGGIHAFLIFAKVDDSLKDNTGKEALNAAGLLPRTIRELREALPDAVLMSDIALDPFSSYGHDGLVDGNTILNDETNRILARMSIVHAEAGVDFVAPSDMMDGRIGVIRQALEESGHIHTGIMAYSAKYASCFYGPFRDALDSAPGFGDKSTYQMDPSNSREAMREISLDVQEGADIVMVKPGMPYLDIVCRAREMVDVPISVYQVSGEFSMIRLGAAAGVVDEARAIIETLTGFRRAGADLIATYFCHDIVSQDIL